MRHALFAASLLFLGTQHAAANPQATPPAATAKPSAPTAKTEGSKAPNATPTGGHTATKAAPPPAAHAAADAKAAKAPAAAEAAPTSSTGPSTPAAPTTSAALSTPVAPNNSAEVKAGPTAPATSPAASDKPTKNPAVLKALGPNGGFAPERPTLAPPGGAKLAALLAPTAPEALSQHTKLVKGTYQCKGTTLQNGTMQATAGSLTFAPHLGGLWLKAAYKETGKIPYAYEAFVTYDAVSQSWHRLLVDNRGGQEATTTNAVSQASLAVWTGIGRDKNGVYGVRHSETMDTKQAIVVDEVSRDAGKTWIKTTELNCKR